MATAYIETSIPSFYFTGRTDPLSISRQHWTRQWWSIIGDDFDLFSSPAVTVELNRGSRKDLKLQRIGLIADLEMLEINTDVLEIGRIYIDRLLMPDDADGDALHLAIASYHNMDVLLTWNCKHLANPNKLGHIGKVNGELGLHVPLITTPLNYLSEEDSNGT
ncbi:MAG: type II toxin-antitoxin system VapC family toxin [Planctomycetales bacterium]|nr:type II toxin-antitoxin system VapC family toxin [Planctomycetales bacterium]